MPTTALSEGGGGAEALRVQGVDRRPQEKVPSMGSSREERVARNEELFQIVNRQIEKLEKTLGSPETFAMVCECGKKHCLDGFEVEPAVYQRVRMNQLLFFVVPGHEDSQVEKVLERTPQYLVVEKVGRAAEVVSDESR
jgi:hypothetical protein